MAELAAKHPARSATARRQRLEQMKRWKEDDTSKASSQPRTERRENRVKFEEGVIFLAATASNDEDEVRRLLKEGSDVNFANVDGLTALHQVRTSALIYSMMSHVRVICFRRCPSGRTSCEYTLDGRPRC